MPISRAWSVTVVFDELPTTIVLDCRFTAVRRMPSHRSFAAATASRTGLPSFSAIASTFVNSSCSIVLKSCSGARSYSPSAPRRSIRTCSTTISASRLLYAPQRCFQRIERVVGAHRDENVAWLHAHVRQRQVGFLRQIELIQFDVRLCPRFR